MARSYQYPQCGPWGITLSDELGTQSQWNASFSQRAWEGAKQDGCLPAPGVSYPNWPPAKNSFVYPTSSKKPEELLTLGVDPVDGFGRPWADNAPRTAARFYKFWEKGANPNGCPMDQAIGQNGTVSPPQPVSLHDGFPHGGLSRDDAHFVNLSTPPCNAQPTHSSHPPMTREQAADAAAWMLSQ